MLIGSSPEANPIFPLGAVGQYLLIQSLFATLNRYITYENQLYNNN
jgi:hypothetical protein